MELTSFANWLNTAFAPFDDAILGAFHSLAESAGGFFTPLARIISFLGEKGIIFFALAVILMLFRKTRKAGICIFGAVCCGALLTNIIIKDMVARPRPFDSSEAYMAFREFIGFGAEDGFSFPSGHVTAAAAGMIALCLTRGKKYIVPAALVIVLMAASRNYLMAHYPTDVIAAAIIGAFSAVAAFYVTKLMYYILEKYSSAPFCRFILNFNLGRK